MPQPGAEVSFKNHRIPLVSIGSLFRTVTPARAKSRKISLDAGSQRSADLNALRWATADLDRLGLWRTQPQCGICHLLDIQASGELRAIDDRNARALDVALNRS